MLDSLNPFTSAFTKSQTEQSDNPEDRVYGSNAKVWPYGLFPAGNMDKKVQVPCAYNYPPWDIQQLIINELDTLWYVPLLLYEKLEELDKKSLLNQFLSSAPGKTLLLASDYMISSSIKGGSG